MKDFLKKCAISALLGILVAFIIIATALLEVPSRLVVIIGVVLNLSAGYVILFKIVPHKFSKK